MAAGFIVAVLALASIYSSHFRATILALAVALLALLVLPPILAPHIRSTRNRGRFAGMVFTITVGLALTDFARFAMAFFWVSFFVLVLSTDKSPPNQLN